MHCQPNAAYRIPSDSNHLEAVYDYPDVNQAKEDNPKVEKKLTKRDNCPLAVAAVAIVLAIVAILFAVVYTTVIVKTGTKDQSESLQSQLRELQTQLNDFNLDEIAEYLTNSCKDLPKGSPSGNYRIQRRSLEVYCDMNRTSCSCQAAEGWTRVAYLDMTDPEQECPSELVLINRTEPPLRLCGRPEQFSGCVSTTYNTYSIEYSHVCGRVIGYQNSTPDGLARYFTDNTTTIDDPYADGVIFTHGQSPREHIWTFVANLDEVSPEGGFTCPPCTIPERVYDVTIPPFIEQDYFCATGSRDMFQFDTFYPNDPLWDGAGCGGTSTCCEFNNPPWFCKQLPQPTTDDIELRLCGDEPTFNEDSPIELVEIYIR